MYFTFQKSGNDFLFTEICQELLNSICQNRDDFIGKTVDTASHIGDQATRNKLKKLYTLAWDQKRVLFYYFPTQTPDIFVVTYLEPQYSYDPKMEIKGRCMPIYKKDIQDLLQHDEQFLVF
ncbi:hypothetical protein COL93_26150 [Bacillus toyonensis]|uniref:Uncharacterized protein n=2 Tax=Bacillus toyonensis TaxID=155322 RepID=A0A2B5WY69_9BACI|nr:hypothetical protein COL93_26150 [Bacillus toyonensis]PHD74359.1 hypothetical protein COF40_01850 [Bacillus toyonensis]